MFEINHEKVRDGRVAYNNGLTIQGLVEKMEHAYREADAAAQQRGDGQNGDYDSYRRAETDMKSFCIGFADGLLADFRRMKGGSGGLRA